MAGASIKNDAAVAEADLLSLKISDDALSQHIEVDGRVCWVSVATDGRYLVGCTFRPHLPIELIQEMAAAGLVDRRHEQRDPISVQCRAQWELQKDEIGVELVNLSRGGCCLRSEIAGVIGQGVRLTISDEEGRPTSLQVTSQWQVETQHGFIVGCQFVDKRSYRQLRRFAERQQVTQEPDRWWSRLLRRGK